MIQNDLDERTRQYLNTVEPDRTDTFLLANGTVRASLLHGTKMVLSMQANHHTGILETYILGHAYLAAGLLTSMIKGRDKIGISIACGGPVKGLDVEATASGEVRGYLHQNPIPIDKPLENFDMSPFFGPGFLTITRTLEGARQPVSGQTMMKHGSIARDLANHFLESEQTPTLFFLSTQFDKTGTLTGAAGLFLQVLPGAEETILSRVEHAALSMPSLGQWFAEGGTAADLVNRTFDDFHPILIGSRDTGFFCPCQRSRFLDFVGSLTGETQRSIREEGPFPLELVCHNCGTVYSFSREEVHAAFDRHT